MLEASGRPIPRDLYPPTIMKGYESWMDAFWDLGTDRTRSEHGAGPIPRSAVMQYRLWMDEEDFDMFHHVIKKLDSAYLHFVRTGSVTNQKFTRDMVKTSLGRGRRNG